MIKVKVPATTANLGPGFDSMGMALCQYSYFECELSDKMELIIEGLESEKITQEDNLVVKAMDKFFAYIARRPKAYRLKIINGIALARGMGSSASAIVGGLMCANALMEYPLSKEELLSLATELEGHPDNVAPALLGNLILSTKAKAGGVIYRKIEVAKDIACILFIPEYEISTSDSRRVLPEKVSIGDAVFNSSHLGFLLLGFLNNDKDLIGEAMEDKIHEPYRKKLIKGFDEFKQACLQAGAFAFCLSGAGSTVIAYADRKNSEKVRLALENTAKENKISGKALILDIDRVGAVYEIN